MKKIISVLLVCVLLAVSVFALASCGKTLSGEYTLGLKTYSFDGSKVKITYELFGVSTTINGRYEITEDENGKQSITFSFGKNEENTDGYAGTFSFSEGTENGKDYIKIAGIKYTKS